MSAAQDTPAPRVSDYFLSRLIAGDVAVCEQDVQEALLDLRDARAEIALLNARLATARRDALLEAAGIAEKAWRDRRPVGATFAAIRAAAAAVKTEGA